jgi:hypothetical protein
VHALLFGSTDSQISNVLHLAHLQSRLCKEFRFLLKTQDEQTGDSVGVELVLPIFPMGQKGWEKPVRTLLDSGVNLDVRGLDRYPQKESLSGEAEVAVQTL